MCYSSVTKPSFVGKTGISGGPGQLSESIHGSAVVGKPVSLSLRIWRQRRAGPSQTQLHAIQPIRCRRTPQGGQPHSGGAYGRVLGVRRIMRPKSTSPESTPDAALLVVIPARPQHPSQRQPSHRSACIKAYPRPAVKGRVSNHAQTIRPMSRHLTALSRLVAPTPRIEVEITWVVESGMPHKLAH